jgi:hypothetical protein
MKKIELTTSLTEELDQYVFESITKNFQEIKLTDFGVGSFMLIYGAGLVKEVSKIFKIDDLCKKMMDDWDLWDDEKEQKQYLDKWADYFESKAKYLRKKSLQLKKRSD